MNMKEFFFFILSVQGSVLVVRWKVSVERSPLSPALDKRFRVSRIDEESHLSLNFIYDIATIYNYTFTESLRHGYLHRSEFQKLWTDVPMILSFRVSETLNEYFGLSEFQKRLKYFNRSYAWTDSEVGRTCLPLTVSSVLEPMRQSHFVNRSPSVLHVLRETDTLCAHQVKIFSDAKIFFKNKKKKLRAPR